MKIDRKKSATERTSSFSLFFLLLAVFSVITLFVFGSFKPLSQTPKGQAHADFGGIENIFRQMGQWDSGEKFGYFENKIVKIPSYLSTFNFVDQRVLSSTSGDNKWIEISLSEQKLRAYEGNNLVFEFPVSSGLPWTPTVTGEFRIWYKTRWTRMTGGSVAAGNYYDLPNVPFNMFFHRDYALHGTYWHNNFGHPMSHGCVNLRIPDAEKLFYWTTPVVPNGQGATRASEDNPGTRVVIHS